MGELIKYGEQTMMEVLTVLFNIFLEHAQFPVEWRTALIVPVFKRKGSDQEARNYRPIALTCVVRRLLERILCKRLAGAEAQLSDLQGGFRSKRSTMHQAFALHEVMVGRPGIQTVLLDLRAAYDRVDRRVLWRLLRRRYGVDYSMVLLLQKLFDENASHLVISGTRSAAMPNLRGLLQGSSLSPLLFNLFIDELLVLLRRQGPRLVTAGYNANCLAFADDLVLASLTRDEMAALLRICEEWSLRVGMQFAPDKCIALDARQVTEYTMYGAPLVRSATATYLGIPFTQSGIDLAANAKTRAAKGRAVTAMVAQSGMNLTGFAPAASTNVYRAFVRPVLEYGLALAPMTAKELEPLQKVQNMALRAVLSAPRHTSINALHKLLQVPPVAVRNEILNAKFATALNNNTNATVPAVNLWRCRGGTNKTGSLVRRAARNRLWAGARKINRLMHPLNRRAMVPMPGYTKQQLKSFEMDAICALDRGASNIAGAVQVEPGDPVRDILTAAANQPIASRVTICRWMTGSIVRHDQCRNCDGVELSRAHALECSGANMILQPLWPDGMPLADPTLTLLDNLLNAVRAGKPTQHFYDTVVAAIGLVYTRCLRFRQAANGYWTPHDPG
jgi:hypothetical protein